MDYNERDSRGARRKQNRAKLVMKKFKSNNKECYTEIEAKFYSEYNKTSNKRGR